MNSREPYHFTTTRRKAIALVAAVLFLWGAPKHAEAFMALLDGAPGADGPHTLSIPLSLSNLSTSNSYVAPKVSYGVAVAEGDIPRGGSFVVKDTNGNPVIVQQDQVVTNPATGLIRFAVLSHSCAETFGTSATKNYTIGASTAAPNTAPATGWGSTPETVLAANTNLQLQFSGGDCGSNTYSISVNNILAKFRRGPAWGTTSPQGGWERYAQGPNCMGWHFWAYITNDSTGLTQGYVRADIFLKAWSPTGPFEAHVMAFSPNMWNTIATNSEQFNQNLTRFAAIGVLYNGTTPVAHFGGPNDYRAQTVANADFNTSNYRIMMNYDAGWQKYFGGGIQISSAGVLPAGLSPGAIYWPTSIAGSPTNNPSLATQRSAASQAIGSTTAWAPNTLYTAGVQKRVNGNILYQCVQTGTSAASGGPSGAGAHIVDGTCAWQNLTVPFTDRGSGTITMSPINAVFPGCGWVGGDKNGDPVWIGSGTRPHIVAGQDLTYLTTKSKATPPYGLDAPTVRASGTPWVYNPMYPSTGFFAISASGDGAGDNRIGYINEDAVNAFYGPSDPYYYNSSLQMGMDWANWPSLFYDERSGYPMCGNNGPTKSGTSYPSMASPQPNWNVYANPTFGVGKWAPWSSALQDANGFSGQQGSAAAIPGSHMPASWYGPYLKTGYMVLHEIGMSQGDWMAFAFMAPFDNGNVVFSGKPYYRIINPPNDVGTQERAFGWSGRILTNARYLCRDASPLSPYLNDICDDNAYVQSHFYPALQASQAATFGLLVTGDHVNLASGHGSIAPWMWSFVCDFVAMEAWRGLDGGKWKTFLNYMVPFFSLYTGNGIAYYGNYDLTYSAAKNNYSKSYMTQNDVWNATFTDGVQRSMPAPFPSQPYIYSFLENGPMKLNFPENCNDYIQTMRMALTLACTALPDNTALAGQLATLNSTINSMTGLSTHGGINWSSGGANHKAFCVYKAVVP